MNHFNNNSDGQQYANTGDGPQNSNNGSGTQYNNHYYYGSNAKPEPRPIENHSASQRGYYDNIPLLGNEDFVGREAELAKLEDLLFIKKCRRVAITGLGGVGKTRIAKRLAEGARKERDVFWISAASKETILHSYAKLVADLQVPGFSEENANYIQLVRDYLSNSRREWLVIYDNADDSKTWSEKSASNTKSIDLINELPESRNGVILFTTRFKKLALDLEAEVVDILIMDEDKAKELFRKRLKDPRLLGDETEMLELLKYLEFLPLGIVQATSYIRKQSLSSLSRYQDLLKESEEAAIELLSEEFRDGGKSTSVGTTWLVSFKQIRHESSLATEYMSFMACIEPKDIPEDYLPRTSHSDKDHLEAIGILKTYSFVTQDIGSRSLNLHRLVHLAMRNWLKSSQSLVESSFRAIEHMANVFPRGQFGEEKEWRYLMPHALILLQRGPRVFQKDKRHLEPTIQLLCRVALCDFVDGQIAESIRHNELAVHLAKKSNLDEQSKLNIQSKLAIKYHANGQIRKTIVLLQDIVKIQTRSLPEDDHYRLDSEHELAVAYREDKQIKKAVNLLEDIVIRKKSLPENDPVRLASERELAVAYRENKQIQKAVNLLEVIVEIEKRSLSENHPYRLDSELELAVAYRQDQQIQKGVNLLENIVIRKKLLPENHPLRLVSEHELAVAYRQDQQNQRAVNLLKDLVIRNRSLPENHPIRLASERELAVAYRQDQQNQRAVNLLKDLVIRNRSLPENHPERLAFEYELAKAYREDKQIQKAVNLLEEIVKIQKQSLPENHPERLAFEYELARAYREDKQIQKAVNLLEEIVKIQKQSPPENHLERLAFEYELSKAYREDKQIQKAVNLLEKIVKIQKQSLPENHLERLAFEHELAKAYNQNGQPQEATNLLQHIAKAQRQSSQ